MKRSRKSPKQNCKGKHIKFYSRTVSAERVFVDEQIERFVFRYEDHNFGISQGRRPSLDYYDSRK